MANARETVSEELAQGLNWDQPKRKAFKER
jgi:hypothetical protein